MTSAKTIRYLNDISQLLQVCESSAHVDGDDETKLECREAMAHLAVALTAIGKRQAQCEAGA